MITETENAHLIAVVGAGPAGLFAAKQLAAEGVEVLLLNRDIKPGGLAEYGIYYNKYKMKVGLRKQFQSILKMPNIHYYGNVAVGQTGDLSLNDLRGIGVQAVMVTVGAQGTKWLGLPGEELQGVYHAKDIVYHYNRLPPFSTQEFQIGQRVALIGVGNVMMDIAHWTIRDLKVDEVIAVARRGPAEVKFSKQEMENVACNLDLESLNREFERAAENMCEVGQDPGAAKAFLLSGLPKALPAVSDTRFRFDFLASPARILGDESGQVCGLVVDDTRLAPRNGDTKAVRMGTQRVLDVDTVIFCIGDKVDEKFGLPVQWNEYVKSPEPRYPINETSFEVYDPQEGAPITGVFVAGWSREASSGLVGVARKDGENGARAMLQYLQTQAPLQDNRSVRAKLDMLLAETGKRVVNKADVERLYAVEKAQSQALGLEDFKFKTNQEMLAAIENQPA